MRILSRQYPGRPRLAGLAVAALLLGGAFSCSSNSAKNGALSSSPIVLGSSAEIADDSPPVVSDLPEIKPDPRERILSQAAVQLLKDEHLLHKIADNDVSRDAFPKYIEALDSLKLFLLQSNYDSLAVFQLDMDNELVRGDLVLARKGAAMLASRLDVVTKLVADILTKPLDFTVDESFETDPKKRSYCVTEDDLRTRWRQKLKLEVLERLQQMDDLLDAKAHPKPADKAKDPEDQKKADALLEKTVKDIPETLELREAKARKELAERYQTTFTRLASTEALRPAEDFINAINAVYDPHTNYLAPAETANFNIDMTGKLEGIGATLGEQDHYIVIEDLVPGGAAWQQGKLEQGDLILSVAQEGKDPVDVTDMPVDKVVTLIRGKKDTLVTLTVKKSDGTVTPITIKRDVIVVEASYARGAVIRLTEGAAKQDVGYIYLPSFYGELSRRPKPGERNAVDDVRQLLEQLVAKNVKRVVFDIRGNPGGLLNAARGIMGLLIKTGPVVQTQESSGDVKIFSDDDPTVTYDGDLVMMVDRFSASASEILSGAVQDYGRGVIVGSHSTHGKGTVQDVIDLDSALGQSAALGRNESLGIYKVTTSEYYRVAGGSTQLRGVTPDVLLPDPTSWVESDEGTLFHALPWTQIGAAKFTPVPHTWDPKVLQAASSQRTSADPNFGKLAEFGKLMKARRDDSIEPLERTKWQAKHKKETDEATAANPKLKDLPAVIEVEPLTIGTPPPASPGDKPAEKPIDKKLQKRLDAWQKDLARDPWVVESIHILEDMGKK
ncbi:MAG: carboxy terminal-processing peptidase [Polyangiaceae bacterium]